MPTRLWRSGHRRLDLLSWLWQRTSSWALWSPVLELFSAIFSERIYSLSYTDFKEKCRWSSAALLNNTWEPYRLNPRRSVSACLCELLVFVFSSPMFNGKTRLVKQFEEVKQNEHQAEALGFLWRLKYEARKCFFWTFRIKLKASISYGTKQHVNLMPDLSVTFDKY